MKRKHLKGFERLRGCLSLRCSMKAGLSAKQHAGTGLAWGYESRALSCAMGERIGTALKELEHALPAEGPAEALAPISQAPAYPRAQAILPESKAAWPYAPVAHARLGQRASAPLRFYSPS